MKLSDQAMQRIASNFKGNGKVAAPRRKAPPVEEVSNPKQQALAEYLGIDVSGVEESSYSNGSDFEAEGAEYKVLTDEEANEEVRLYIEDSLWAFNTDFIMAHTNLPDEAEEMVANFQEKAEGANETIKALITDLDAFVDDAVASDGRGHFLSSYDSEENEQDGYFIYRTN